MRIALVILHADPARGGAERYTVDLAAALTRRGHDVTLLANDGAPDQPIVPLAAHGFTRAGSYHSFQRALYSHLASQPYDVVHAMLPVPGCDVYHPHAGVAAEAVASGTSLSRWVNTFNHRRRAMARVEKRLLSSDRPPIVLCLSDVLRNTFHRHYPQFDQSRLVRLFNGVELTRFDPTARPSAGTELRAHWQIAGTDVVALIIAQDFDRKGLPQTLSAIAGVADPRLKLVVVGKQNPAPYQRAAARLGITSRVIFAGPTADPLAFYHAADFFVMPTRHDPCSLVALEALAMGVPVISTAANGACEIMEPNRHGTVLSDPDDIPALTAAIVHWTDPLARAMGKQACLSLRPALSQAAHVERLETVYARLNQNR